MFGTLAEGLTKEELMIQVVDYQEKLKEEKLKREALEKELSLLKKEYGQKIFEMQNQVLKCHKDVEDARAQAEEARIKLLKSEQALDRFKMSALMKKSAVDSQYPVFYEVKKGDSLWRISAQKNIYNDPYKWMEIYTANRDKIDDPEIIYPGQVLRIPRYFEYLFGAPVGEPENIPEPDVQTEEQGEPDDE
ncbi:MAG: LysM peptidoglycan-binding domain-containing protein [Candidatus Aureabacteria bacterium]|nr:LysM peptidoglycan-binding domain-containing protein [Candidatus Auribacterota bacterium]